MIKCIWLSIFAIVSTTAVMAMDERCGKLRGGRKWRDYMENPHKGAGWFYVSPDAKWNGENEGRAPWEYARPDIEIDCRSCEQLKQEEVRVNNTSLEQPSIYTARYGESAETQKWRAEQLREISKRRNELKCE